MTVNTAKAWLIGAWAATTTFLGRFWTAAKASVVETWSFNSMIPKLAAGLLVAGLVAVGAALVGAISWAVVPMSIAADSAMIATALTGIHLTYSFMKNFVAPVIPAPTIIVGKDHKRAAAQANVGVVA